MTSQLATTYLGLELASPLVASASPLTGDLDALRRLEAAGAGAVVLPSLFEEQIVHEALELHGAIEYGTDLSAEATSWLPDLDGYNTGPGSYLALIEAAKASVAVPVVASLNATTPGSWARYARLLQEAGADALELNIYDVAADPGRSAAEVEARQVELVSDVRAAVTIPLAVKLSPFYTSLPHVAAAMVGAGADGLVLFNRFTQPDIDPHTRAVLPRVQLSTPEEVRLPLRWIAILRGRLTASLAASSGVHDGLAAARLLLAGADVVMATSALLHHGPDHLGRIESELRAWMDEEGYESVGQLRGSASQAAVPDPAAFERAHYLRALTSYGRSR